MQIKYNNHDIRFTYENIRIDNFYRIAAEYLNLPPWEFITEIKRGSSITDIESRWRIEAKETKPGAHVLEFYDDNKHRASAYMSTGRMTGAEYMVNFAICLDGLGDDFFLALKKDMQECSDLTMYKYHIAHVLGNRRDELFDEDIDMDNQSHEYDRLRDLCDRCYKLERRSSLLKIAQQENVDTSNVKYFNW